MPRRLKGSTAGLIFHVMNRGVRRATLFTGRGDYDAFIAVMREVADRAAMRVLAFAIMPNHWHMVLWPQNDRDLTAYVGRVSHTHACRWHRVHQTRGTGPVYQDRFKAIPIKTGAHLLFVLRYVERNPVRAGLVSRAEDWPWSSATEFTGTHLPVLHPWPVPRPANWPDLVNEPEPTTALALLRECVTHSAPYGDATWTTTIAAALHWTKGLRPVGRPRAEKSTPD